MAPGVSPCKAFDKTAQIQDFEAHCRSLGVSAIECAMTGFDLQVQSSVDVFACEKARDGWLSAYNVLADTALNEARASTRGIPGWVRWAAAFGVQGGRVAGFVPFKFMDVLKSSMDRLLDVQKSVAGWSNGSLKNKDEFAAGSEIGETVYKAVQCLSHANGVIK